MQNKLTLGIITVLVIAIVTAIGAISVKKINNNEVPAIKTYTSQKLGLSFSYPASYFVEEKNIGNGEREIYQIELTADTQENRLVREGKTPPREGPTAITITNYQNNLDNLSVEQWVKNTNDSNFKLSPDGKIEAVRIAGTHEALTYHWSGLYEGTTIAFAHNTSINTLSVTYISPNDQIVKDFDIVKSSLEFH